jgi:hypothetical protein
VNLPPRKGRRSQVKHVFSMVGEHAKSKCWLKLEDLNEAMRQPKISVPKPSSSGKWHALSAQDLYASLNNWILDSGASHHMTHSHELFPSTSKCSIS